MERLFTIMEAAAVLHTPVDTLRYWRHKGTGPVSFKLGPRRVVYAESELVRWIAEQRAGAEHSSTAV